MILSNKNITKCGVSVDRDLIELMYLSPFDPISFVDLGNVARENEIPHHGLRGLVAMFLKHRISKALKLQIGVKLAYRILKYLMLQLMPGLA